MYSTTKACIGDWHIHHRNSLLTPSTLKYEVWMENNNGEVINMLLPPFLNYYRR
jgi:hypothetical protein